MLIKKECRLSLEEIWQFYYRTSQNLIRLYPIESIECRQSIEPIECRQSIECKIRSQSNARSQSNEIEYYLESGCSIAI